MAPRGKVGEHLWVIVAPGTNKMTATRCLLCKELIYERGDEPHVQTAFVKGLRLHFLLRHDIDATDLPEVL